MLTSWDLADRAEACSTGVPELIPWNGRFAWADESRKPVLDSGGRPAISEQACPLHKHSRHQLCWFERGFCMESQ